MKPTWFLFLVGCWSPLASSIALAQTQGAPTTVASSGSVPAPESRLSIQQGLEAQRLAILKRLDFFDFGDPAACVAPPMTTPSDIDLHRSLFVHDRPTLDGADFSLQHTLGQIAGQVASVVPGTTATTIFRQLWDTQNSAPGETGGPHCTDNGSTVNGFPNACRTSEGAEAQGSDAVVSARLNEYRVLSLVNRIDLVHEGWRNCGEFRIIYGKSLPDSRRRNFIIFEAVLPNPKPGCREGCLDVAKFWRSLSTVDDPATRATMLQQFFYAGLPGFRPVVHVDHYSAKGVTGGYGSSGSGQIRTNQFLQDPWMLKEFKTVIDCGGSPCKFQLLPIMVKVNPWGELWNEDVAHDVSHPFRTLASNFQNDVLLNVSKLADANLTGIGYSVALDHDASQSFSQFPPIPMPVPFFDEYLDRFNAATGAISTFRTNLAAAASAHALTANQLVNRAMTQSCGGCHNPFGLGIGPAITPGGALVTSWPISLGFVHVDARVSPSPGDFENPPLSPPAEFSNPSIFGSGQGHRLSPALHDVFLPHRRNFLLSQLNAAECVCRNRFRFLARAKATEALGIQRAIDTRFAPRFDRLNGELKQLPDAAIPPTQENYKRAEARIKALSSERDRALRAGLKKKGMKLPEDDRRPRPLRLDAAKLAKGNAAKERELRELEVLKLIKEEPPRRTVMGSFAVH